MGVFGALSGVPAGYIADRTRRDTTLHVFGAVTLGAVLYQPQVHLITTSAQSIEVL